jgi:hypothetical protein
MTAQTSDKISSLAARYFGMSNAEFARKVETRDGRNEIAHDVRAMAASLVRQDETKGLRKFFRKVLG